MIKKYLLSPGPTPVPERVMLAMAEPILHHRTPQFSAIMEETRQGLKEIFGTKEEVLILSSSGTGAMDATITNTLSAGDRALVINGGKFGERWGNICDAYGVETVEVEVEWGKAVNPADVKKALDADPSIKAVLVQASETSTCASHPIKELAALIAKRDNTILVVDGITAVGVYELPMDEWGIDVLLSGSQKAFMLPPGLAFIALSKKAQQAMESSTLPKFYFNLAVEIKKQAGNTTNYTSPVTLIVGLREVLRMLKEEGLKNSYRRLDRLARAARAGVSALGMQLVAPDCPSGAVTGAFVPEGIDGVAFVKLMRDEFGVTFAGGQAQWKGKVVRIAHLGYFQNFDIIIAMSALEMALHEFGQPVEFGRGVAAATEVLKEEF
jgi:aspartate aminotransferase-like enzyme